MNPRMTRSQQLRRRNSIRHAKAVALTHRFLQLEPLEEKIVLSISVQGIPDWEEQGPGPILGGLVDLGGGDPVSGAVEALAAHPDNADILYAGTINGGVWRTFDATSGSPHWEPLTDQMPSLSIADVALSPLDDQTLFFGTGLYSAGGGDGGAQAGAFRSTNGGDTWEPLDSLLVGEQIRDVVPTSLGTSLADQVVLVSSRTNGLFRSTDGGDNFMQISGTDGCGDGLDNDGVGGDAACPGDGSFSGEFNLPLGDVSHVVGDPQVDNRFYLAMPGVGVFRSVDGGVSWEVVNNGISAADIATGRIELSVSPAGPDNPVYVATITPRPNDALTNVYRSDDQGDNWAVIGTAPNVNPGFQGAAHFSMLADQNDENLVYVAGDRNPGNGNMANMVVGDASDGSWTPIVSTFLWSGAPHADSRDMVFDANGEIIDANDGGIARADETEILGVTFRNWNPVNGDLHITEFYHVSLDTVNDLVFGGTQDVGSVEQATSDDLTWDEVDSQMGDGGTTGVINDVDGGVSVHFTMGNNLNNFIRRTYVGGFIFESNVSLNGLVAPDNAVTGLNITPYAVNAINSSRLAIGEGNLYESPDLGDNLTQLNVGGAMGVSAVAFGGTRNDVDNEDVLWAGVGGNLYFRDDSSGTLTQLNAYTAAGGGGVRDIVLHPNDWGRAYLIDANQVWFTDDEGDNWTDITGNLTDLTTDFRSVDIFSPTNTPGDEVVIVGSGNSAGGVYRTRNPEAGANALWTEFGQGLPTVVTKEVRYYDENSDTLLAGTWGRGAWTVSDASETLDVPGVLTVCGDEDYVNQDDVIRLVRDVDFPTQLNVFLNNESDTPDFTIALAAVEQINVFGIGGNDSLELDSSSGLISVPAGIRYDGDGACPDSQPGFGYDRGFDTLILNQTDGDTQTSDTYSVGPAAGSGSSVIEGPSGVQTVFFEELEPVIDLVPATDLIVNGTAEANLINYYPTGIFFVLGEITIDDHESITFGQKAELTINAGHGDDTVILDNQFAPLDLAQIAVNGGDGNDSVINRSAAALPQVLDGGTGDDFLVGGPDVNTISGGPDFDTIGILGTPDNNVIDVQQDDDSTLTSTTDGNTRTDTFDTVEAVRVDAGLGDDIIRVAHDDSLVATPGDSLPFEVFGDGPNASDRLAVHDDGIGDTVIYRVGADDRSGSVTVGPLAPVRFDQIEYLDVTPLDTVTGGTGSDGDGRLVVFKPDPFENNNTRTAATHLGGGATINVDPVIDPGGFAPLNLPGDEDWFEFVAAETGVLDIQVSFEQVGALSNGRDGLPGDGDLDIDVYDADGDTIASSTSTTDNERVTIAAVRNETYYLRVRGFGEAVNVYNLTVINVPAPVPFQVDLQAASDSGRNDTDDITNDTTATFDVYLDDDRLEEFTNIDLMPDDDYFVELYNNGVLLGTATFQGPDPGVADNSRWEFTAAVGDLQEGHNNFVTAAVRMRDQADPRVIGRGEFSLPLQVTLDTVAPNGTVNLHPDSDSGVWGFFDTMEDLITSDMVPLLYGASEANALVRVALDIDENPPDGIPDGTTVALPYDGDEAFPPPPEYDGNYFLQTILNLTDGEHTFTAFFRDVAGNETPADEAPELTIFVDTQGPKITNVTRGMVSTDNVFDFDGETSLFEPKPSPTGPDPLVHSIVVHFSDLPDRTAFPFDYDALLEALAAEEGNYQLVGDHNGNIAIVQVNVTFTTVPNDGLPEAAEVELVFDAPLPDDRFTLWVSDSIADPAGNPLDGESGAQGPFDGNDVPNETPPIFPTGDGAHGGDFHSRFTIDSRPEFGTFALGTTYIDINGNFVFDPEGKDRDYTNRDIVFQFGFRDDIMFAGNFAPEGAASATGYDKLGAYGTQGQGAAWHWRLDFDHDGVIDYDVLSGKQTSGEPVAGNFSAAHPGDEIGLFNAGKWFLDTTGNNNIGDPGDLQLNGDMRGFPVVGDFDGDGLDDLGTWNPGNEGQQTQGAFEFDLAHNGLTGDAEHVIPFDFSGVFEHPVAADMNGDGIDDLGLFVSRREAVYPEEAGEWFFLISDVTLSATGQVAALDHAFTPVPFGNDVFAQYGYEQARPVVGNFDPPVGDLPQMTNTNAVNHFDVNYDFTVSPLDALLVINALDSSDTVTEPPYETFYVDVNADGHVSPLDALMVINYLDDVSRAATGQTARGPKPALAIRGLVSSAVVTDPTVPSTSSIAPTLADAAHNSTHRLDFDMHDRVEWQLEPNVSELAVHDHFTPTNSDTVRERESQTALADNRPPDVDEGLLNLLALDISCQYRA